MPSLSETRIPYRQRVALWVRAQKYQGRGSGAGGGLMEMPAAFSGKVRRVGHGGAPGSGDSATRRRGWFRFMVCIFRKFRICNPARADFAVTGCPSCPSVQAKVRGCFPCPSWTIAGCTGWTAVGRTKIPAHLHLYGLDGLDTAVRRELCRGTIREVNSPLWILLPVDDG